MQPTRSRHLLIVEDEGIVALDLKARLSEMGYDVVGSVATGEEAIARAADLRPDIVLMDIRLAGHIGGIDATRVIRGRYNVPVVYLTAYSDDQTIERVHASGADGYLRKPIDDLSLRVTLELALVRHQAERRVRESEHWLSAVMTSVADAVVATDPQGTVRLLNSAGERLTGVTQEAARGQPVGQVLRTAADAALLRPPLSAGRLSPFEDVLITRDGHRHPIEVQVTPIRNDCCATLGTVWAFHDITERRRIEQSQRLLIEASALLGASIECRKALGQLVSLVVPVLGEWCVLDLAGEDNTIRMTAAAHVDPASHDHLQRTLGRPLAPADRPTAIDGVLCGESAHLTANWLAPARLSEALRIDTTLVKQLGGSALACVPIASRGNLLGLLSCVSARRPRAFSPFEVSVLADLGRRIAVALDNARLYRAAQQAVRLRNDVLAIVSHDLRSPVTTILLSAEALLHLLPPGAVADSARQRLTLITRSATRMRALLHDLVDAARIEAGQVTLDRRSQPLAPILDEAADAFEPQAEKRHLTLRVAPLRRELVLRCDRDRVLQVLFNLLDNAIKFTPDRGTITVAAEEQPGQVVVTVSDNGPGIPKEMLPHLFDRYWQAEAQRQGAGLGLFIARGLVEAHGGRIWVDSAPGMGSSFHVLLPLAEEAGRPEALPAF